MTKMSAKHHADLLNIVSGASSLLYNTWRAEVSHLTLCLYACCCAGREEEVYGGFQRQTSTQRSYLRGGNGGHPLNKVCGMMFGVEGGDGVGQ